jgi:hypothetical protein
MKQSTSQATDSQERLELRYIPLSQAQRWDENPKKHDLDALIFGTGIQGNRIAAVLSVRPGRQRGSIRRRIEM